MIALAARASGSASLPHRLGRVRGRRVVKLSRRWRCQSGSLSDVSCLNGYYTALKNIRLTRVQSIT